MGPLQPGDTIGILGGGQLGRMLAIAATQLGLRVHIFAPDDEAPAGEVAAQHTRAAYEDRQALIAFARGCKVITCEFENIPAASLALLATYCPVRPGHRSLEMSQDRLIEKQFLESLRLSPAPWRAIHGPADIVSAQHALGGDCILKTRRLGYDGKGQVPLKQGEEWDAEQAWRAVDGQACVLEKRIDFLAEVSAIIVRAADGRSLAYDVPVNTHSHGILHTSSVGRPAGFALDLELASQACDAAARVADALDHVGVLTVEFFVTQDRQLLVNEFAPRVHNSGHWTLDACLHSQFDNHIRAVGGWPLGSTQRHSDALMTNLIGDDVDQAALLLMRVDTALHLYGKSEARAGRKMGHTTRLFQMQQTASVMPPFLDKG